MGKLRRSLTSFARDRAGSVLVYAAFAAPVIVGLAGLSADVSTWHLHARLVQSAADSAAIAAALEIMRTGDEQAILDAGALDATTNGYGVGTDLLTINHPPLSGPAAGSNDSVEVILERAAPSFLAHAIVGGPVTVSSRAVARVQINDTCVWSLNPTDQGAITVTGGAQIELDCGIVVNSDHPEAFDQGGSSCVTATKLKVVGNYSSTCLNTDITVTGVHHITDPMASLQAPQSYTGGCDHTAKTQVQSGDTATLYPGVYCNDIVIHGTATFDPGLYVIKGAALIFGAQSVVTGNGVTFYLVDSVNNDTISINGGASVTLIAAATGDMPGVLFYQDRNDGGGLTHSLNGGANMYMEGIIYFPNQDVHFSGGSGLNASKSMILADTVTFSGNTEIGSLAGSVIEANNNLISATLIE